MKDGQDKRLILCLVHLIRAIFSCAFVEIDDSVRHVFKHGLQRDPCSVHDIRKTKLLNL